MKVLYTLLLLNCVFLLGCQPSANNPEMINSKITVPELLDRNEKLYNGKEWESVQNEYVSARETLTNPKLKVKSSLRLAALFTNEARITGEHGHYYPAALQVLNNALTNIKNEDDHFLALTMKAGVLLSQHEFQEALSIGKTALNLNPHNAHIYGVLVDAYVELGDYTSAVAMADKMVNLRPDLRSYARISYLREIHGDIKGAKAAMQLAVDAGFPTHEQTAWTRLTLGELLQTYGETEAAAFQYQKILTQRENYPFAIAALAGIAFEKKDYKKAEVLLQESISIIPEVGFYIQLAELYQATNRKSEVEKIIPAVFEMLEDDVVHGHNMNLEYADLYLNLIKDYDKALEYAEMEYTKRPKNIDVNRMLAKIYNAKDSTKIAKKYATLAGFTGSLHPDLVALQQQLALR